MIESAMLRRTGRALFAAASLVLAGCAHQMPPDYPDRPGIDPGAAPRMQSAETAPRAAPSLPPPVYVDRSRSAASLYFYPERGQDDALQDRDRYECYRWAVRQTGVDPGMTPVREVPPPARRPPPVPERADVAAGAVTGAVVGSVVGSAMSTRHHGAPGAVLGAIFGAMIGASANESRQRADAADRARDAARAESAQRPMDDFRRAMTACMEGRGYRVR
jgi:hypothetical protein